MDEQAGLKAANSNLSKYDDELLRHYYRVAVGTGMFFGAMLSAVVFFLYLATHPNPMCF